MLPMRLKNTVDDPSVESFLYFCQVLDEQLYDFTDHSFKAPALNTFTRTLELQNLAAANHHAGIGKDALLPFIEELDWSISNDPVLNGEQKNLCKFHIKAARESLDEPDRIAKSLAGLRLSLGDYFESIKEEVKRCLSESPQKKGRLAKLASAFIVQAELLGFPRRHTYHTLQIVIRGKIYGRDITDYSSLLNSFFDRFSNRAEYECTLLVSKTVSRFPRLLEQFGIELLGQELKKEGLNKRQLEFIEGCSAEEIFIKVRKIDAPSAVRAQEISAATFAAFVGIVRYVEHRLELNRSRISLVERTSDSKKFIVRDSLDPMHCWSPSHNGGEEEMLLIREAVNGRHFNDSSKRRVARAFRYHGAALQTLSPENQLVDLWAALEGILSTPKKGLPRVEYFAESILPVLTLSYAEKLIDSIVPAIKKEKALYELINENVKTAESDFSKAVHFLFCSEYEDTRQKGFAQLKGRNPLLLNRCWDVTQRLGTRKALHETLKMHRKKLKWHVCRIYAMRNSIMHNASALPYLPTLVENLHVYLDSLINALCTIAVMGQERISIESALQYLKSYEQFRVESLGERNPQQEKAYTIENVWENLFGSELAIAPSPPEM